eukprot:6354139-Karenia_brevis.AAC.1
MLKSFEMVLRVVPADSATFVFWLLLQHLCSLHPYGGHGCDVSTEPMCNVGLAPGQEQHASP